jgi:hypothetical protein
MTDTRERERAKDIPDVLFFGKNNCQYSLQALQHLKLLGFNVQAVFQKTKVRACQKI